MTVSEALGMWAARQAWEPKTRRQVEGFIRRWAAAFGGVPLEDITAADLEAYRATIARPPTANKQRTYLRAFFKYAKAVWDRPGADPMVAWPKLRETPRRDRRALTRAEIASMLDLVLGRPGAGPGGLPWLAWLIRVGAATGLREGTIRKLRPEMVREGVLEVPARIMKMRQPLRLPVTAEIAALLAKPEALPDTAKVWREFRKCAAAAGVVGEVSPHDLRRTFRARLVESGASTDVVMALGGWSSPGVMMKHYRTFDLTAARKAVEAI